MSVEELKSQLHHFNLIDGQNGAIGKVFQVKLETSTQNIGHVLVADSLIDLALRRLQDGLIKDLDISQSFEMGFLLTLFIVIEQVLEIIPIDDFTF